MSEDITYCEEVINYKYKDLYKFCWLYPFTNENISGYYSAIDFNGKNVLSVVGSGDHILNAFLLGAKELEAFDTNPLAKYYVELKIASIKALSLEEFILFLYNKTLFKMPKHYLNKDLYIKVREKLEGEYLLFWDHIFNKYSSKELYKSFLFTDDFLSLSALIHANKYFEHQNYEELKKILQDKKIEYHDIGLKDLKLLNKQYDIVVLSNIPAFLEDFFIDERLKKLKELIDEVSNKDSKVIVSYLYYNLLGYRKEKDNIYNSKDLRKYFPRDKYKYHSFESADIIGCKEIIKKLTPKQDMVFMSK